MAFGSYGCGKLSHGSVFVHYEHFCNDSIAISFKFGTSVGYERKRKSSVSLRFKSVCLPKTWRLDISFCSVSGGSIENVQQVESFRCRLAPALPQVFVSSWFGGVAVKLEP